MTPNQSLLLDGHLGRFDYGENGVALFEVHPLDRAGSDDRSHRSGGGVDDNL